MAGLYVSDKPTIYQIHALLNTFLSISILRGRRGRDRMVVGFISRGRRGRDRMVVGFISTNAISAYAH